MTHFVSRSALIGALVLASSCLTRPGDPEGIFAPVGTLTGTITDGYDQVAIEGAKVTINYNGSSQTATTDKTGSYSFQNIPATSGGGVNSSYQMTLDLSAIKGDRKYKPYRTSAVAIIFGELRRSGDATGTNQVVQNSIPVGYLVSNLSFNVRQTRGIVSGTVMDRDLKPLANIKLVLVNNNGGGFAIRNGGIAATMTTGADGKYSATEIEEGGTYNVQLVDQTLFAFNAGNAFNYNPGSGFTVFELGVETVLKPMVLVPRPASDTGNWPYVLSTVPTEDSTLVPADVNKPIVIRFNKPMNTARGLDMVNLTNGFRRIGPRNRPNDFQALNILFTPSWNMAGTEFTLTPNVPLEAGYRYQIDFNNGFMFDTLNNNRNNGNIPFTDPAQSDALAIANGTNDLLFEIGSDNMPLTVTPTQEPDTADNNGAATVTRAFTVEGDPTSTESSFRTALNSGFFANNYNNTNGAYIVWSAPSKPVRRYRVWTRVGMNNPILISVTNGSNPWGVGGNTRREPLAPNILGFSIPLGDLNAILSNESQGLPNIGLPNTTWDNNLSVQLGVSAVNGDGQEGDITFVTLQDNTGPAFLLGSGFGRNDTYQNSNEGVLVQYPGNCANITGHNNRFSCQKLSNPVTGVPAATTFGQRILTFDLSEQVDAASIVTANALLEDGTLPNNLNSNMNVAGAQTESDATIASVFPINVVNGRTNRFGVLFNNFFGLDTGDRLLIRNSATAAFKDLIGNVAKDAILIRTPFVDNLFPMIKSVTTNPTTDEVTITMTKWVNAAEFPATSPNTGNIAVGQFTVTNANGQGNNGDNGIVSANHSINSSNESQIVLKYTDLGYFRGFNSSDTLCQEGGFARGTRVGQFNLKSIDFSGPNTRSTASHSNAIGGADDGRVAYENVLPDAAAPAQSPGAYLPASGVGTRSSLNDTIPPRLSSNYSRRTLNSCNNGSQTAVAANNGTSNRTVVVYATEFSANENSTTAADSALNPANWEIKLVDLGTTGTTCGATPMTNTDPWFGKTGAGLAQAGSATVVIDSVSLNTTINAGTCQRSPVYNVNVTITNADTTNARFLAVGTIKLKSTVADMAGNAVGASPVRATWAYDPSRADNAIPAGPNPIPGWVVQ